MTAGLESCAASYISTGLILFEETLKHRCSIPFPHRVEELLLSSGFRFCSDVDDQQRAQGGTR